MTTTTETPAAQAADAADAADADRHALTHAARAKGRNRERWASARTSISAVVIVVWCLLPAYRRVVTAFREVAFTYDPTQWFTHFTLDNFATAFSTERGNRFGDAPINSFIVSGVTTVVALLIAVFAA